MATDLRGRHKPYVVRIRPGRWRATVIRGYGGNYEAYESYFGTWREAYGWAYEQVKRWRP